MAKKILLVEDNEENWDMLSRRLRRRGFEVVVATDGEQGVAEAKGGQPDLILMDMNLPKLDGWGATRLIRTLPGLNKTPIIALTAHESAGDQKRCLDAGCDAHMTKPVDLVALLEKIDDLIGPVTR